MQFPAVCYEGNIKALIVYEDIWIVGCACQEKECFIWRGMLLLLLQVWRPWKVEVFIAFLLLKLLNVCCCCRETADLKWSSFHLWELFVQLCCSLCIEPQIINTMRQRYINSPYSLDFTAFDLQLGEHEVRYSWPCSGQHAQ